MKKNLRFVFLLLAFVAPIAGCAAGRTDEAFSLSGYNSFEVVPIANESGETFDPEAAARITGHIRSKLKEEGFSVVTNGEEKTLVIKSSIVSYTPGNSGTSSCTVKSILIDKKTKEILGEIVTTTALSAGGLTSMGVKTDDAILQMVADNIVAEIDKILKEK